MASEIIAKQLTMIILQTILKALGGGGGASPFAGGPATGGETNTFAYAAGAPQFRADGGSVRASTPYLVGERGPELFVPGTSGGVMSNSDLRASMGAAPGSSGGPVLNMSFETSTINGVEYVSRDQLEAAMAQTRRQAARDGAQRGMSMTLDRLQQSPSTRKRVGF
jgi:phage-related minor tail protein